MLQKLIDNHKFNYTNSNITEDNFPIQQISKGEYKLFHFDKNISSKDAIKEMKKSNYQPANIYELLSWEKWNKKDFIAALGSVWVGPDGSRGVACLGRDGSGRDLDLRWYGFDWDGVCRFLAVPVSKSLETGTPNTSDHLDTLNLEELKNLANSEIKIWTEFLNKLK